MRPLGALAALLLTACGSSQPAVIDGRTEKSFALTAEQARQDLPVAERLAFDRALASAPARRFGAEDGAALRRLSFDGMTAAEVVADYRARQH